MEKTIKKRITLLLLVCLIVFSSVLTVHASETDISTKDEAYPASESETEVVEGATENSRDHTEPTTDKGKENNSDTESSPDKTESKDKEADPISNNTGQYLNYDIAPYIKHGDVDGDGEISVADTTFIQRFLALMIVPDFYDESVADVDNDNNVSITDATQLQRYLS